MKIAEKNTLYLVGIFVLLTVVYLILSSPWPGDTVSIRDVTTGSFYKYEIGDSKEVVLKKGARESFSPKPKPAECPNNWIDVSTMSDTQKQCLLKSNKWGVGFAGEKLCESGQDYHVTLNFMGDKLATVTIRCTKAL